MPTVIPTSELDGVITALNLLGGGDLATFVSAARALVQGRAGVALANPGSARQQFKADARQLNDLTAQPKALDAWLEVAALQLDGGARETAEGVRAKGFRAGRPPLVGAVTIPERIIERDESVPFSWLVRAVEAAGAVAWLSVPRIFAGKPPSGEAKGTGLLIHPTHLLTCLHVLDARQPGEDLPAPDLLAQQVAGTRVAFDFNGGGTQSSPNVTIGVNRLVASDRQLDYAVLELAQPVAVAPPPLWIGTLPEITATSGFVVNILQHPLGRPKVLAMRNNAAALVDDETVAYWTDTDQGSSGAPVFDDDWQVIALHRAYEERTGLKQEGREMRGANVGSRITRIHTHLAAAAPALAAALNTRTDS